MRHLTLCLEKKREVAKGRLREGSSRMIAGDQNRITNQKEKSGKEADTMPPSRACNMTKECHVY